MSMTLRFLGTGTMEIQPTRLALLVAKSLGRVVCPLSKACDDAVSFHSVVCAVRESPVSSGDLLPEGKSVVVHSVLDRDPFFKLFQ